MLNGKLENSFISGQDKETLRRTRTERQNYEEISKEFRERIVKDLNTDELKSLSEKSGASLISVQAMMKVQGSYLRNIDNTLKKLVKVNDNFIKALTKNLSLGTKINLGSKASILGSYATDNRKNVLKDNKSYDTLNNSIHSFTDVIKKLDERQRERTNEVLSMLSEVPTDMSTNISMALDKTLREHPVLRRIYGTLSATAGTAFNWTRQGLSEMLGLPSGIGFNNLFRIVSWNTTGIWEREVRINRSLPLQTIISLLSSIQKQTWLLNNSTLPDMEAARRGAVGRRETEDQGGLRRLTANMGPVWRLALSVATQVTLLTRLQPAMWLGRNLIAPLGGWIYGALRVALPLLGNTLVNYPIAGIAIPQVLGVAYNMARRNVQNRIREAKARERRAREAQGDMFHADYDSNLITRGIFTRRRELVREGDRSQGRFGYFLEELRSSIRQRGIRQYIGNVFRSIFNQDALREERREAEHAADVKAAEDFKLDFIRRIARRGQEVVEGIIGLKRMEDNISALRERIVGADLYTDMLGQRNRLAVLRAREEGHPLEEYISSTLLNDQRLRDLLAFGDLQQAEQDEMQGRSDEWARSQNRRRLSGELNAGTLYDNIRDALHEVLVGAPRGRNAGILTNMYLEIIGIHTGLTTHVYGRPNTIRDNTRQIREDINWLHLTFENFLGQNYNTIDHYVNQINDTIRALYDQNTPQPLTAILHELNDPNNGVHHAINELDQRLITTNTRLTSIRDTTEEILTRARNRRNDVENAINSARFNNVLENIRNAAEHLDNNFYTFVLNWVQGSNAFYTRIGEILQALNREFPEDRYSTKQILNDIRGRLFGRRGRHGNWVRGFINQLFYQMNPGRNGTFANTVLTRLETIINALDRNTSDTLAYNIAGISRQLDATVQNSFAYNIYTVLNNANNVLPGINASLSHLIQLNAGDNNSFAGIVLARLENINRTLNDINGKVHAPIDYSAILQEISNKIVSPKDYESKLDEIIQKIPTPIDYSDKIKEISDKITLGKESDLYKLIDERFPLKKSDKLLRDLNSANEDYINKAAGLFTNAIDKKDSLFYKMAKNLSGIYKLLSDHFGVNLTEDYDATHYFAEGGIVTKAVNAVVGEKGTEAILPLEGSKAKSWIGNLVEQFYEYKKTHTKEGSTEPQTFVSSFLQEKIQGKIGDIFEEKQDNIKDYLTKIFVKPLGDRVGGELAIYGYKSVKWLNETALGKTKVGVKLYGFVDKVEGAINKVQRFRNNVKEFFKDPLRTILRSAGKPDNLNIFQSIASRAFFPMVGVGLFLLLSSSRFKSAIGNFFKEMIPNIMKEGLFKGTLSNLFNLSEIMPTLEDQLNNPMSKTLTGIARTYGGTPVAAAMDALSITRDMGRIGTHLGEGNYSEVALDSLQTINDIGRVGFGIVIQKLTGLPYNIATEVYDKFSNAAAELGTGNSENLNEQLKTPWYKAGFKGVGNLFQSAFAGMHGDKDAAKKGFANALYHLGGSAFGDDWLKSYHKNLDTERQKENEKEMSDIQFVKAKATKYGLDISKVKSSKEATNLRQVIEKLETPSISEKISKEDLSKLRNTLTKYSDYKIHGQQNLTYKTFSKEFMNTDEFSKLHEDLKEFNGNKYMKYVGAGKVGSYHLSGDVFKGSPIEEYSKLLFWLKTTGGDPAVQAFEKLSETRKAYWIRKFCEWRYPKNLKDWTGAQTGKQMREDIMKEAEGITATETRKNEQQFSQAKVQQAVKEVTKETKAFTQKEQAPNASVNNLKDAAKEAAEEAKSAQQIASETGFDNLKVPNINTNELPTVNGADTTASTLGQTLIGGVAAAYDKGKNLLSTGYNYVSSNMPAVYDQSKNLASSGYNYLMNAITPAKTSAAEALARNAYKVASSMGGTKSTGYCARGVKNAMMKAGIIKKYPSGNAWQMSSLLSGNNNFQEITNQFANKQALAKAPRGSIIVWNKKDGASKYGHIAVSLGNGKEASDHVRNTIVDNSNRYGGFRVFYPVSKDGVTYNSGGLNINELANSAWEGTKTGLANGYNTAKNFVTTNWSDFKNSDTYKNNIAPLAEKADSLMQTASEKISQGFSNISMDKAKELGAYYVDLVKKSDYNVDLPKIKEEFIAKAKEYGLTTEAIEEYYNKLKEAGQPVFSNIMQKGKELYENTSSYITEQTGHVAENTLGVVGNIKAILMSGVSDKLDKLVKLFEELKVRLEQAAKGTPIAISNNVNNNNAVTNNTSNNSTVMNNEPEVTELSKEAASLLDAISE